MDKIEDFISQFLLAITIFIIEDNWHRSKYRYHRSLEDEYYQLLNQYAKVFTPSNVVEGLVSEVGSDFIRINYKNRDVTCIIPKNSIYSLEKDLSKIAKEG
ncbi:hypothetical protein [Thermoanaerobacterium sp. RBIITD]|uniref:hypothetical protein n=1 Tax=Thermoanaerobacterium sp. RBIITD TaxID=1550240 RepID=UPI000BB6FA08|nr:hypothetical protein [Thermoanaerobacterium sp. RBIITD]SNX53025.1 hypothetical protein SAMN05660242_0514 [Thermoanaerobacterium sp. RBIITD]